MKNVTEIRAALLKTATGAKEVAADGKLTVNDLSTVVGLVGAAGNAVEDAKLFFPELAASTNEDVDQSDKDVDGLLKGFNPESTRDLYKIEQGVLAVLRMVARARAEGIEEGRAAAMAEMGATPTK